MKKLICLLLVVSILMSSSVIFAREYLNPYKFMEDVFRFDIGDFTADIDNSEEADEADINMVKLLETLGIWDDVNKPLNSLLTKTEFSIIMSNLKLGPQNALKGVYAQKENVNEEKATYKDAYEHLLEALGYYYRCAQFGNTNESLLIVASEIDLISQSPENINGFITRKELAKLITKALTIDLCALEYTYDGHRYAVAEGKNLLNTVHNIYEISGFVNAIPGLAVYGNPDVREGYIQIDRKNFKTNGIDLSSFFGSRVVAYALLDEQLNEFSVIYMDYAEDYKATTIDFYDINNINSDYITYVNEEGTEFEIAIGELSHVIENGDKLGNIPNDISYYNDSEGKITLTSSERNGKVDTAIIYKYNYYVVSYVDTNNFKVGFKYKQEYKPNEEYLQLHERAVKRVLIDGLKSDYSKLTSGTAIRIFQCDTTGYTEIIGQTKKAKGEIIGMYGDFVTIGETEYRQSKDFLGIIQRGKTDPDISDFYRVKDLELGLSTSFEVFENLIVGYASTQIDKWGYLKSVIKSRTGIDPDLTLRILNEDNEWVELKITDKFELDGKRGVTKEEFVEKINANSSIMNNIVRYKTGKVDEISSLDTVEISPEELDSSEDLELCYEGKVPMFWTREWLGYDCPYRLSADTVLFIIPMGEEDNEKKIKVVKTSVLPETGQPDTYHPMRLYTPNQYNIVSAAIYTQDLSNYSATSSSSNALFVEKISSVVIDSDNQINGYKLTGKTFVSVAFSVDPRGGYFENVSYVISEEMIDRNEVKPGEDGYDNSLKVEAGDVIFFDVSGGEITNWNMALKEGRVPLLASETPDSDDVDIHKTSSTWTFSGAGIVEAVDTANNLVLLSMDGSQQSLSVRVKVVLDVTNKKVHQVSIADFYPGDKVFVRATFGNASFIIKNIE